MLLISYDISNNKLRTKFSKFLKKFGYRKQYSVFEIKNSDRILKNIQLGIAGEFEPKFSQTDSILIIETSETCKITRYGYAKNDESDLIIV
ncbi:CRISPR-associated protein Cas2 [Candidatus Termititenax dinenymphae]|uniref:CRISPR-associated endoribonuclease Cas2 n=1 Tax=Candidatus Termititenax dinenymphae TaxID=2218523 RepID=A0A388TKW6_9BACT|nr:CRISPR-associated protein Cas2 [Candidatus Termititenax dinenymphae]